MGSNQFWELVHAFPCFHATRGQHNVYERCDEVDRAAAQRLLPGVPVVCVCVCEFLKPLPSC